MLSIITLRTHVAGTAGVDSASLVTTGHTLVAVYNWTFLLSQSLMPVACDLLLGYVPCRSGLVPRILPIVAFVGAPLLAQRRHFGCLRQKAKRPARRPELPAKRGAPKRQREAVLVVAQSVDTLWPASAIYQQWDPITPTHQTQS